MDADEEDGRPFAIPDLWKLSSFTIGDESDNKRLAFEDEEFGMAHLLDESARC